tara:strand:+ start:4375 stop:5154 length:780 start_codon:yes stop_codon:yes gene_type:complete
MEPIKFEEHIKDKLENRTIRPSIDAWNRLESSLGAPKKQHKSKPFVWIGVAASIVGALFVVSQFFNKDEIKTNSPSIVVTPKIKKQIESTDVVLEKESGTKMLELSSKSKSDSESKTNQIIVKPFVKELDKDQTQVASIKKVVLQNANTSESPNMKSVGLKQEALSFEDQKIQDVVAQVQSLKDQNETVSDAEIDNLLQQAQKEIRLKQLYNKNIGVVDARLLLQDVEQELDKSFRDKAFEILKANFNFIKTAVARRND